MPAAWSQARLGNDGNYNLAVGLDAIIRPFGDEYINLRLANTFDKDVHDADGFDFFRSNLFRVQWERRTERGFSYRFTTKRYGPDFIPEMGFLTRQDIVAARAEFQYGWFGGEDDWFRQISPGIDAVTLFRNSDGSIETSFLRFPISLETIEGTDYQLEVQYSYEDLIEDISFPENTDVPIGSYNFVSLEANRRDSFGRLFRTDSEFLIGSFYDGWRIDLGIEPAWTVSKHLLLEAEYAINVVRFPDRNQEFEAHIFRFKTQLALNTKASLNAFVQYNSAFRPGIHERAISLQLQRRQRPVACL